MWCIAFEFNHYFNNLTNIDKLNKIGIYYGNNLLYKTNAESFLEPLPDQI